MTEHKNSHSLWPPGTDRVKCDWTKRLPEDPQTVQLGPGAAETLSTLTPPSVNGIKEQLFQKEKRKNGLRPSTRDQVLPFNVVAVMAGRCSAVRGSGDTAKAKPISFVLMQSRRDLCCRVAFSFYSLLSDAKNRELISTEAVC